MMEALDGNAIAGTLLEYFGKEMTVVRGVCGHCGSSAQVAQLRVYSRAPGSVVRCPACGNVVMVAVTSRAASRVYLTGFQLSDRASG